MNEQESYSHLSISPENSHEITHRMAYETRPRYREVHIGDVGGVESVIVRQAEQYNVMNGAGHDELLFADEGAPLERSDGVDGIADRGGSFIHGAVAGCLQEVDTALFVLEYICQAAQQ